MPNTVSKVSLGGSGADGKGMPGAVFMVWMFVLGGGVGKSVSNGQESWGRDSGARDLSPEVLRAPTSSEAGSQITENEVANCSIVDLANKVRMSGGGKGLKDEDEIRVCFVVPRIGYVSP